MEFLQVLQDPGHPEFEAAWNTFFLDVSRVQSLAGNVDSGTGHRLLSAGLNWSGSGWNSSKASKTLWELTGVPLVKAQWVDYRNAFLYALSMLLEVEVVELELADRVADAAFALLSVFTGKADAGRSAVVYNQDLHPEDPGSNPAGTYFWPAPATEASEEEVQLSWDTPKVPLPVELAFIWSGTTSGDRRLDMKTLLGVVPRFAELPASAPANNHRWDSNHKQDKKEKEWQQKILHAVRLLAHAYSKIPQEGGESAVLLQQLFQLLTELYVKLENSRKENSIPGSISPQGEVLFDKQELQAAMQARRINNAGKGRHQNAECNLTPHSFLSSSGRGFGKGFGGRGFGFNGGFGYGSQYRGKGMKPFFVRRPFGKGKGMAPRNGMEPALPSARSEPPSVQDPPPI